MFSLIISIIAIALVAALSIATLYYGGGAFGENKSEIEVSTFIQQSQQVEMAILAHKASVGQDAVDFNELVSDDYLKEMPMYNGQLYGFDDVDSSGTLNSGDYIFSVFVGEATAGDVCTKINEERGTDLETSLADVKTDGHTLGCLNDGMESTAYYRI